MIVDWVPAHFPKDDWALARFDGTALYEHADPRQGEHPDWGTLVFNFGRNEVRNFLVANALYWIEEFHIDGLRVDAVASMLYLDYSREAGEWVPNAARRPGEPRGRRVPPGDERRSCYGRAPRRDDDRRGVDRLARRVAADRRRRPRASASSGTWAGCTTPSSTSRRDPVHRRYHHHQLTFGLLYAFSENFVLPLSHDEVVHGKGSLLGKMPGDALAAVRQPARAARLDVGPPRQAAAVHGRRARPVAGVVPRRQPRLAPARRPRATRACRTSCASSTASAGPSRRCGSATSTPSGFRWIDANDADHNVFSFVRFDAVGRAGGRVRGQPGRHRLAALPRRAAARRPLGRGARHRRARRPRARSRPSPCRGTASRSRSRSTSRRSA